MVCDSQKVNLGVSWFIETVRWCVSRKQLQLVWRRELLSSLSELRRCTCICLTGLSYSAAASLLYKKSTGDFKEMLRTPRQYLLTDLDGVSPQPRLSTSWFTRRCWSTPSLGRPRTPCRSSTARWIHSNREAPTMNQLYCRMSLKYETCF